MLSNEAIFIREYLRKNSVWNMSLDKIRENLKNMDSAVKFPEATEAHIVDAEGVSAELFIPAEAKADKLIVYFHGGGYCLGVVATNRSFVAKIAKESGYKALLIDYRLSPENPYPAAHEDAIAAYKWVLKSYRPENVVFLGDSSGCGLMLATLLKSKELRVPMPAAIALMSPMLDFTKSGESLITRAADDPNQYEDPFYIADSFLGNNDENDPYISPVFADLSGFPPMLIHASNDDVFLSDSTRLAENARKFGVNAVIKTWEGLWHIFHMSADILPEGREALGEIYAYLDERLSIIAI